MIEDYTGWDFRMWLLAVVTGVAGLMCFRIRKCVVVSPGQKRLAVICVTITYTNPRPFKASQISVMPLMILSKGSNH